MNGLGKAFILLFPPHQEQQGDQAIRPNMGLIIALSHTSRDGGRLVLSITFPAISVDSSDGNIAGAESLYLHFKSFSEMFLWL